MANYFSIYKRRIYLLSFYVILLEIKKGCHGLSADVIAPSTLAVGSSASLECKWRVGHNEEIYSVKWYQGLNEIYRYIPGNHPKSCQRFLNDHLTVDLFNSNKGIVKITNVTLNASGIFRCEVSGEAPSFYTVYGTVNITIVSPPDGNPVITGKERIYQIGDWVDLKCHTPKSKPSPILKFYVNDQEPREDWLEGQKSYVSADGLHKPMLRLHFTLTDHMLDHQGAVRIKCTADITDVYSGSTNFLVSTGFIGSASAYGAKASIIINNEGCLPAFCLLVLVVCSNLTIRMSM